MCVHHQLSSPCDRIRRTTPSLAGRCLSTNFASNLREEPATTVRAVEPISRSASRDALLPMCCRRTLDDVVEGFTTTNVMSSRDVVRHRRRGSAERHAVRRAPGRASLWRIASTRWPRSTPIGAQASTWRATNRKPVRHCGLLDRPTTSSLPPCVRRRAEGRRFLPESPVVPFAVTMTDATTLHSDDLVTRVGGCDRTVEPSPSRRSRVPA